MLLFRKSQPEGVKEMYEWFKNERFFGAFRVRSPVLILRDPDLVKNICVKDFAYFMNRGIPNNTQVREIREKKLEVDPCSLSLLLPAFRHRIQN